MKITTEVIVNLESKELFKKVIYEPIEVIGIESFLKSVEDPESRIETFKFNEDRRTWEPYEEKILNFNDGTPEFDLRKFESISITNNSK